MSRSTRNLGLLIASATILLSSHALAAKFANPYSEFELPPQWSCNLESTVWICQNSNDSKKPEAMIMVLAKTRNEADSFEAYLSYLKAAKSFTAPNGKGLKSDPKYAKFVTLSNHQWVDSLHMESELPGTYTRYLATIKEDIGVLITFTVLKDKYQSYVNQIDQMVKTLKVFRQKGTLPTTTQPGQMPSEATIFGNQQPIVGGTEQKKAPKGDNESLPMGLLLVVGLAIAGFIIWKKRQNAD
jgi:hypothetical protein